MDKCKWSGDQGDENDILSFEKDRDHGFSWPQRNYKCSYCNREFKSAQALGGHMNVHRRDRAKMRLSSPSLPSYNPNTSFSSSPKFLHHDHKTSYHPSPSCASNPKLSASSNEELELRSNPKEYEFSFDNVPIVECSQPRNDMELCGGESGEQNNVAMVDVGRMLDLSMSLVEDAKDNQDLDLELRLGY